MKSVENIKRFFNGIQQHKKGHCMNDFITPYERLKPFPKKRQTLTNIAIISIIVCFYALAFHIE